MPTFRVEQQPGQDGVQLQMREGDGVSPWTASASLTTVGQRQARL